MAERGPEIVPTRQQGADAASPGLVDMFCRAFDQDAHINWLVRQDAGKRRAMRDLFRLLLSPGMGGDVYATADGRAAALWFAPDAWHLGWTGQTAFFLRYLGIAGWPRALSRGLGLKRMETRHPDRPHYYLQLLGVDPECQGHGHGRALVAALLARCDQERVAAYLETSSESNVSFYARAGFSVVAETRLADGLLLRSMLREPASPV